MSFRGVKARVYVSAGAWGSETGHLRKGKKGEFGKA